MNMILNLPSMGVAQSHAYLPMCGQSLMRWKARSQWCEIRCHKRRDSIWTRCNLRLQPLEPRALLRSEQEVSLAGSELTTLSLEADKTLNEERLADDITRLQFLYLMVTNGGLNGIPMIAADYHSRWKYCRNGESNTPQSRYQHNH